MNNRKAEEKSIRPPAVPLVTVDPYFSIWSMADKLYYDSTRHWTGTRHSMTGIIRIGGRAFRFMGNAGNVPPMHQTGLKVTPLSSIYTFEACGIRLKVTFTTPLLPGNPDIMSRPVSYIAFEVSPVTSGEISDGSGMHKIGIYFDAAGELCVNKREQEMEWGRVSFDCGDVTALRMGSSEQPVLAKSGDDLRIDWGYAYLAAPSPDMGWTLCAGSSAMAVEFAKTGMLPGRDDTAMPGAAGDRTPVMAAAADFDMVGGKTAAKYLLLAYDDIFAVEYFGKPLKAYWARNGKTIGQAITEAVAGYDEIMERCRDFDSELMEKAFGYGGKAYAEILALSYRQTVAAHKAAAGEDGELLFFSKECFSNGCMATVDVSYPSSPLFLLYCPEMLKGMLRPVFKFAQMPVWGFEFAPHDVGRYPHANGQVYALKNRPAPGEPVNFSCFAGRSGEELYLFEKQMPVEECGNMLIMTAAVCLADKSAEFAFEYLDILKKWAEYLIKYGQDPGDQLCTDDFAGHLDHNVNLAVKAIIGVASFGIILRMLSEGAAGLPEKNPCAEGYNDEAAKYLDTARRMAEKWEKDSDGGTCSRLTFDKPGTWSMKYNLIWDSIFETGLFSRRMIEREITHYKRAANEFGVPLDCRNEYTKSDWLLWCAALAESPDDFNELTAPLCRFLNETPCRVPFTDWYETVSGYQTHCRCHQGMSGFRNRTVQGGLFIKLLKEEKILSARRYLNNNSGS
ncbi:MAG: DUF4965 domain-containing protein [Eubacteriales bacterium]|nr:DUF4965 domain-containing protein [Eubacteriales bacterium]